MLLMLIFSLLVLLCFGIVLLVMRPRKSETRTETRLKVLVGNDTSSTSETAARLTLSEVEVTGPFAWVEIMFQTTGSMIALKRLLLQARSSWQAGTLIAITAMASLAAGGLVYYLTNNLFISLPVIVAVAVLPFLVLSWRRKKHIAAFEKVLPDAIDMCGRSLRAGHSVIAAIGIVAEEGAEPAKTEFAEVFRKQNFGIALREALMQMLERMPSRDLQIVVTAILVQKDTGGNLAEIMDRVVEVIRDRARIQAEVRIHTAQGRFTGWVLCLLPVILLGLINLISPGYSRVLFQEGTGRTLLYAGLTLLALGGFTIRQIIHGIEV